VFVVIEGFKADDYREFFAHYVEDAALATSFGVTMPPVYGYKTTTKKPVLAARCEGTHYREWRQTFVASLLTPENVAAIAIYWRARPEAGRYDSLCMPTSGELTWIIGELGAEHPIVTFCAQAARAEKQLNTQGQLKVLARRAGLSYEKSAAYADMEALKARYPLLRRAGFQNLWHVGYGGDKTERNDWADYVQLHDARHAPVTNVVQLVSIP
jgi:hypothetical protein